MSTDLAVLEAFSNKTKAELRYVELVNLRTVGISKRVYLCIGVHAVYIVRKDMKKLVDGGEIFYAHIERCVEDTHSRTDLLILMNDNHPVEWKSEKLYFVCEHRRRLLDYLTVAWTTDYMWRFARVIIFPRTEQQLRAVADEDPIVEPFEGCVTCTYQGYSFFLRDTFKDMPNAIEEVNTGTYVDPNGIEVTINVHEPRAMIALEAIQRDHIRWVAMEYEQSVCANLTQFYVIRNQPSYKLMNLSDDCATWSAWEIFLKSEEYALVVILLRRQYLPPLMDTSQDIAVLFKVPMILLNSGARVDGDILSESRIIADTMTPINTGVTIYRDMVQAKLDSLQFLPDAYKWIESRLYLKPNLEPKARVFMKAILKLMHDENALTYPDLLREIGEHVPPVQDPLLVPHEILHKSKSISVEFDEHDPIWNTWYFRVAKYLACMVDGGLLGSKFQLGDLVENVGSVSAEADKKIRQITEFLLHIRNKDFAVPYQPNSIILKLRDPAFGDFIFNDHVMQVLLEVNFIRKLFPETDQNGDVEYVRALAKLLGTTASSLNLKASICRQIINTPNLSQESLLLATPSLMEAMRGGNIFLATYATATLVNLSARQDQVKNTLMSSGCAELCIKQLKLNDDDLMLYTLILLVNLTKNVHHRHMFTDKDLISILADALMASYQNVYKFKISAQLAAVIGQLANDEDSRQALTTKHPVLNCFLYIFDHAPLDTESGVALKSKVMFAMKQLSANSAENKRLVGSHCIAVVLRDLKKMEDIDFVNNGVMLLTLLAIYRRNVELMAERDVEGVINYLSLTWVDHEILAERIGELLRRTQKI